MKEAYYHHPIGAWTHCIFRFHVSEIQALEERGQKGNSEIGPLQAVRSMGCLLVHVCAV